MDGKSKTYIEKRLNAYPKVFLPQEKIYAAGNTVYVSEFRFFNLSILGKLKGEVPIENVLAISNTKFGSLLVEKKDGTSVNFGVIDKKEFSEFQRVLLLIQAGEIPEYVEAPAVKEESPVPMIQDETEVSIEQRVVREAPPHYGTVVANESFGLYKVRIFSDGYIQISKGLGLFKGSIEKLLEIEGESQITKKSALGRGLAGVVTLGKNQLAPNQRGNLILTITTDKVVHVLIEDLPQKQWIVSMNKLVAVGKSVIKKGTSSEATVTPKGSPNSQSLAQQIRELSELKDAGIISEKEFESAKQKLLS
jgi:hypothetical protein